MKSRAFLIIIAYALQAADLTTTEVAEIPPKPTCSTTPDYCQPGYAWDFSSCGCVGGCPQSDCEPGYLRVAPSCSCEQCVQVSCSAGQHWVPKSCHCDYCPPGPTCTPEFVANYPGCVCAAVVGTNHSSCVEIPNCLPIHAACYCQACVVNTCEPGSLWNSHTCSCSTECSPVPCETNYFWDQTSCVCLPCPPEPSCASPENEPGCPCTPLCTPVTCLGKAEFNATSCSCECLLTTHDCSNDEKVELEACSCVPRHTHMKTKCISTQ